MTRACAHCGEPTANAKYCTSVCMKTARRGPDRHCAECGKVLRPKQKLACSYKCSGLGAGHRPMASAATDAMVRAMWQIEPQLTFAAMGKRLDPPISKSAVQRIGDRLELPKRIMLGRRNLPLQAPKPLRPQRPPGGPTLARNGQWALTPRTERKAPQPPVVAPRVPAEPRVNPATGAMDHATFGCAACALALLGESGTGWGAWAKRLIAEEVA
jgi:hypothetical protein